MFMKKERKLSLTGRIAPKLLVALALLLVLGGCLTACGGGRTALKLEAGNIPDVKSEDIYGVSQDRLQILSQEIAQKEQSATILAYLKAASEGYDMTAEDYNAETPGEAHPEKAGEFAYNVIKNEALGLNSIESDASITPAGVSALIDSLVAGDAGIVSQPVKTLADKDIYGVDAARLKLLANTIASFSKGSDVRAQLVAAMNGYDMTAEGFDDNNLGEAQPEKAGKFAFNVIQNAGFSEKDITPAAYENITPEGVAVLVKSLQNEISIKNNMDLFTTIFYGIAQGFKWLIAVPGFGSFILGLLYFSVAVELLMLPMGINQQKNSRKQALLRPKEMAIRKKYAGRTDQVTQQKISQEIQEMYQREGFNPMSGCLPLLLSLIIIIPLYNLVIDPMKYMMGASADLSNALFYFANAPKAAGGLGMNITSNGTIELLSSVKASEVWEGMSHFAYFSNGEACVEALQGMLGMNGELIPKFTILGQNFGLTPGLANPWLMTVPVLTFASYFASTKFSRKLSYQPAAQDQATGCSNKMMDIMMPLMSVWFTFMVPAAVGLYWIFKSLIGMLKSFIVAKAMPLPEFTEADFKAAEKELAAKEKHRPAKKNPGGNPNVRSLHHIDDEDDLPPAPPRADVYVEDEEPAASEAEGAYLGEATLKEDDRPQPQKKDKKKKKDEEKSAPTESNDDFATNDEDFDVKPLDNDQE